MPNHCYNRVTIYAHHSDDEEKSREQIAKLKDIFEGESIFPQIIPEPDWVNTPLMSKDVSYWLHDKRGEVGELPQYVDGAFGKQLRFRSTDKTDDRWYDWRLENWDTKWDAYDVEILDEDPDQFEVGFNTAWSPPEAICNQIREDYPDVSVSWFYDEPGCELAGYL
tara:strand:+ start:31 stop:528 length:498 start_codon:yes stop_codon:yes gene_type:complete